MFATFSFQPLLGEDAGKDEKAPPPGLGIYLKAAPFWGPVSSLQTFWRVFFHSSPTSPISLTHQAGGYPVCSFPLGICACQVHIPRFLLLWALCFGQSGIDKHPGSWLVGVITFFFTAVIRGLFKLSFLILLEVTKLQPLFLNSDILLHFMTLYNTCSLPPLMDFYAQTAEVLPFGKNSLYLLWLCFCLETHLVFNMKVSLSFSPSFCLVG